MKENPSAVRSKDWLLSALIRLMQKRPFSGISIKDIAEAAQLDRRTFYRHFKCKEDILSYGIAIAIRDYMAIHQQSDHQSVLPGIRLITATFFAVCQKHQTFLLLLHRQNLDYLLLAELKQIFPQMHFRYHTPEEAQMPYFASSFRLAYHIGGFWNVVSEWLEEGAQQSPEELTDIVLSVFSTPMI